MSYLHKFINKQFRNTARDKNFWAAIGPFAGGIILIIVFILVSYITTGVVQKGRILGTATSAYENLSAAHGLLDNSEFDAARLLFAQAGVKFTEVEQTLSQLTGALAPFNQSTLKSGLHLTRAGMYISTSGYYLSEGLQNLLAAGPVLSETLVHYSSRGDSDHLLLPSRLSLHAAITDSGAKFEWSLQMAEMALEELSQVNRNAFLPEINTGLIEAETQLTYLREGLAVLIEYNQLMANLTGGFSKTYFIILQNTMETRPTGGFIGSYGLLRLREGRIGSLLIESIYEIDGRLTKNVTPPEPLNIVAGDKWSLRDANWWPDFAKSAETISQFYEWQAGETVDGIIGLTLDMLEDVIRIIGPVAMPQYEVVVTGDNFYEVVQDKTSHSYDPVENIPKKFMSDLAAAMLARLPDLSSEQTAALLSVFFENMYKKDILLWSRHDLQQSIIKDLGLSGEIKRSQELPRTDLLLISNANLSGSKNARYIRQEVKMETNIGERGLIENNLTVRRSYDFPKDLENMTDVNYLRIYVPAGSMLNGANHKVNVTEELDRTVFSILTSLEPGESIDISLKYYLPSAFKHDNAYGLLIERNPGQVIVDFSHTLILPTQRKVVYAVGTTGIDSNILEFRPGPLEGDNFLGVVFE